MSKDTVLFNEKCSVCNFEIQHYKKRSDLTFIDCSSMEDKYLKALHVQLSNGIELSGIDAFVYVWEHTKGYQWLGKLVSLPLINQASKMIYFILANILYWRFKILEKTNKNL